MRVPGKIRVMIVDDHFLVRIGLISTITLESDMEVVAEAENAQQALALFQEHRPDVTLMDLKLPGMTGVEATAALCSKYRDAKVVVLTNYEGQEDIYRALQAGARSYLLKNSARQDLLAAIRAVHAGRHHLPPEVSARLAERMHHSELTARERDVLELIVEGLSNKEIADRLKVAEGTVKVHVNNILGKLGVGDRTGAATVAIQRGIIHLG